MALGAICRSVGVSRGIVRVYRSVCKNDGAEDRDQSEHVVAKT